MIDLLITNGLVIDGSGSPGFFAAVLVEGDSVSVLRGMCLTWTPRGPSTPRDMWFVRGSSTCTPTPV